MVYEPPVKITIPTPSFIPHGRGINSTGKRGGNLRIRCTNKEYDMIQAEAVELGLSLANFCRWCAIQVSLGLIKHRETESNSMSAGDGNELSIE